jgi:hypothetical protein
MRKLSLTLLTIAVLLELLDVGKVVWIGKIWCNVIPFTTRSSVRFHSVERLLNFQREHIRTERRLGVKMLDILFSILTLVLFGTGLKILHYYWIDNFFKLGKDKKLL